MACLVACGPSAEQKAAAEKAKSDSVAAVQRADSMAMASKKQHMDDSIKAATVKADSTTSTTTETKETTKTKETSKEKTK